MRRRLLHLVAGAGPVAFLAVATIEGFLRPDYDPVAQPISALALGPRGWIQAANFALITASFAAFAVVLRTAVPRGVASRAAPAVLAVMAVGTALAGIFPMDPLGVAASTASKLHELASLLVFPGMPVLLLVAARRFRGDPRWRRYFAYTLATGVFTAVALATFLVLVGPPGATYPLAAVRGLAQRIILVPFFAWIAVITRAAYARVGAMLDGSGSQGLA